MIWILGLVLYVIVALGAWRTVAANLAYGEDGCGRAYDDPKHEMDWGICVFVGFLLTVAWPLSAAIWALIKVPKPPWPFRLASERRAREVDRQRAIEKVEKEVGLRD